MREFNLKHETTITDQTIADLVITAFEGGITYWCDSARAVERDDHGDWQLVEGDRYDSFKLDGCGPYTNPEFWDNDKRGYRLHDQYDEVEIPKVLTLSAILNALHHQPKDAKGTPMNWMRKLVDRVVEEQYDAEDADTLVQIAVFNHVVYG
jgi:hypothetical protein